MTNLYLSYCVHIFQDIFLGYNWSGITEHTQKILIFLASAQLSHALREVTWPGWAELRAFPSLIPKDVANISIMSCTHHKGIKYLSVYLSPQVSHDHPEGRNPMPSTQ